MAPTLRHTNLKVLQAHTNLCNSHSTQHRVKDNLQDLRNKN